MTTMTTTESSLTSPNDRDRTNRWKPDLSSPKLTEEEVSEAMNELNNTSFTRKFPRVDRTYADPQIPLQTYGLLSFIPSKGAVPDKDGFYGFLKLRGNFATEMEANQKAEELIRNVDSYHEIYHAYVGRPIPLTNDPKYVEHTEEIDIKKKTTETISKSILNKKKEEQREIDEIKEKEKELLNDVESVPDPYDNYITLRVKKAQLSWTYLEHHKKIEEIRSILLKTHDQIKKYESENPTYKEEYYNKYMEARGKAGIDISTKSGEGTFMEFMLNDAELPGVEWGEDPSSSSSSSSS